MIPSLTPDTTRLGALKVLGEAFRAGGIETAQRDARLLTLAAAGIVHADLIRAPREPLGAAAATLEAHARRRLAREPVARILGEWEFWSLPFTLCADTLVPRPDSETVVAAALLALGPRRHAGGPLRILDLGTASGCLLVALLSENCTVTSACVTTSLAAPPQFSWPVSASKAGTGAEKETAFEG
ncbi:MAG: hypothetical protein ACOYOJ_08970, partial [Alsobacter sp.]